MSCDHPTQIDLFPDAPVAAASKASEKNETERTDNSGLATSARETSMPMAGPAAPQYLTDLDVAARFSISRPTVWRWAGDPGHKFPAPIKLSQGVTRWRLQDLLEFEASLCLKGGRK